MFNRALNMVFGLYLAIYVVFSVFSYALTDPNLVLLSWQPYWQFQTWMWQTFFSNNLLLSISYLTLIISAAGVYLWLLFQIHRSDQGSRPVSKPYVWLFLVLVAILSLSYNALSHDVFNYIFNAKLVLVYHQDPHLITALSHPEDDWTRFMHNTHTSAPYGYGWTALSLLPFTLGFGKFVLTWLAFRLLAIVSLLLLFKVVSDLHWQLYGKPLSLFNAAVLFLNPLLLIEIITSMHNDLWMMVPALVAIQLALKLTTSRQSQWVYRVLSLLLLMASISIKFASVVLLPILLILLAERRIISLGLSSWLKIPFKSKVTTIAIGFLESLWRQKIPLICSMLLFLPLLTSRSQLFQPWYLIWSLSFLPLIKQKWWRLVLLAFSFSSLLRYLPWMWVGAFEGNVVTWQQLITWSLPVMILLLVYQSKFLHPLKQLLGNTV